MDMYLLSRSFYAANIDQKYLAEAGTQLKEFLTSCKLGERICKPQSFDRVFDPHYFNCYSYEHGHAVRISEGLNNGLTVVVNTDRGKVTSNEDLHLIPGLYEPGSPVGGSDGVRVIIHEHGTQQFPLSEGFDVPSGFSASIGLIPKRFKRLGKPYGQCTHSDRLIDSLDLAIQKVASLGTRKDGEFKYRVLHCQQTCLQKFIIDRCNCKDNLLPDFPGLNVTSCRSAHGIPDACSNAEGENETSACMAMAYKIRDVMNCMSSAKSEFDYNSHARCDCNPSCTELKFEMSYSLSKWPAPGLETDMVLFDINKNGMFRQMRSNEARELMRHSFARVNVFIEDSYVETIEELPDYTSVQLVSDFGGQLGLWIGVSALAACEVIELLYTLCSAARKTRDSYDIANVP